MSYDVSLCDDTGAVLDFPGEPFKEGGTYSVGGTAACELNITYNYAEVFGSLVRDLHGKTAAETRDGLESFVAQWPNVRPFADYWAPTPGNAVAAVKRLLAFAVAHPLGVWDVS